MRFEAVLHPIRMSTLQEIEAAADQLPPDEKQELILFLAARMRATGVELPPPRAFRQIAQWIAENEEGYRRFIAGA